MATLDRETLDRIRAEAKGFVENYYWTFDANQSDLLNLCREESVLNFEGREKIKGKEAIFAKLTSLQQCQYQISKIDCAPHVSTRGALVLVNGFMWLDGKQDVLIFSQVLPVPWNLPDPLHVNLQSSKMFLMQKGS